MAQPKIKFCGLTRPQDIEAANLIKPEYIGFVFWEKSSRLVTRKRAKELKRALLTDIKAVGVFVDEDPLIVAELLNEGIIDIAQLHGSEDEEYIGRLRSLLPGKPIIKAFLIKEEADIERAGSSSADFLLLDSGTGTGRRFNWELIKNRKMDKPVFLAGGLDVENVEEAISQIHPYAVDVSSGIETGKIKDIAKMQEFATRVRKQVEV